MNVAKTRACFWFGSHAEEAAEFYVTLMPDSRVERVNRHGPDDGFVVVEFTLGGTPYLILQGGPQFELSPALSISVITQDQAETDRLWASLTSSGGKPSMCGWLIDRFGLSWQIIPEIMPRLLADPNRTAAQHVSEAMLQMQKIEIAELEAAYRGD
ncbi:VOC family protein [Algicella marina]|uniref:VOC family protein n=1 Tax=Algicella marina TaxID=2683284 RepID=A0A6P1T064_9RHOB|nr:VOC family protein [Algicella marina]QHQ34679.1 VOC family protein [Algicella marina]